jgi:hypothetical protein
MQEERKRIGSSLADANARLDRVTQELDAETKRREQVGQREEVLEMDRQIK